MPSLLDCNDMPIEDLGISQECLKRWKRLGISTVGDILSLYENIRAGFPGSFTIGHLYVIETDKRLKAIGCLPDHLIPDE